MTIDQPLVSIIVPIYNTEQYLQQCVDSLTSQTLSDIEIILVNDGSPGPAAQMLEAFALTDPRIVTVNQENRGLPAARNAGLAVARGTYVGFVDSDDWVAEDMYAILLSAIVRADADVAMCDYQTVNGDVRVLKTSRIRRGAYETAEISADIFPTVIMDEDLDGPDVLSVWRCLYRRHFLAEHRIAFDPEAKYSEDYLFSLAVMLRAQGFVYEKGYASYLYRYNPDSISRTVKSDSWRTYVYLNEALEREIEGVRNLGEGPRLQHQIRLHMLYFALNTANRILASSMGLRTKSKMLREIGGSERLRAALSALSLRAYPFRTRLTIALLQQRASLLLIGFDGAIKLLKRLI